MQNDPLADIQEQLALINAKLDMMMLVIRQNMIPPQPEVLEETPSNSLAVFTTKQHAVLQMLVRGAGNPEIAGRLGVTVNTAKVHVRSIARKLHVKSRTDIRQKIAPLLEAIDFDSYRIISGGLPLDWDAKFQTPDPHEPLYKHGDESGNSETRQPPDG